MASTSWRNAAVVLAVVIILYVLVDNGKTGWVLSQGWVLEGATLALKVRESLDKIKDNEGIHNVLDFII